MLDTALEHVQLLDVALGPLKDKSPQADAPNGRTGPAILFGHMPTSA